VLGDLYPDAQPNPRAGNRNFLGLSGLLEMSPFGSMKMSPLGRGCGLALCPDGDLTMMSEGTTTDWHHGQVKAKELNLLRRASPAWLPSDQARLEAL